MPIFEDWLGRNVNFIINNTLLWNFTSIECMTCLCLGCTIQHKGGTKICYFIIFIYISFGSLSIYLVIFILILIFVWFLAHFKDSYAPAHKNHHSRAITLAHKKNKSYWYNHTLKYPHQISIFKHINTNHLVLADSLIWLTLTWNNL